MKDLKWNFADRLALVLTVAGFLGGALWIMVPTSVFIREISLTVTGPTVRFVRELPFGHVSARWRSEITLIDGDGFECNSGAWRQAEYQPIPGNTVTYQIGDWAKDCLEAGPPFYLSTTRQVLFMGIIPLRQSRHTTEVEGERNPDFMLIVPAQEG